MQTSKKYALITDYITGRTIPDAGAEANRQAVERILVEQKGFLPETIAVDMPVAFTVAEEPYESAVDLVIYAENRPFMVIKCAAGSLDSRRNEVIAAARILFDEVVPYAVASDGKTALVFDAVSAKQIAEGMDALPGAARAREMMRQRQPVRLTDAKKEKARLVFRSYDTMNVNAGHRIGADPDAKGAYHETSGD